MVVAICIGSSCHLKGSRDIVQKLERLIKLHNIQSNVELKGSFCMGDCKKGVCVKIDNKSYSLSPDNTEEFFKEEVLRRVSDECN